MAACIVGWGRSRFGRPDNEGHESLIVGVSREAMANAAIEASEVDGIWFGNRNGGFVPDTFCSSLVLQAEDGQRWKTAARVENAWASAAALAGVFNMGGSAVANCVSIREAAR